MKFAFVFIGIFTFVCCNADRSYDEYDHDHAEHHQHHQHHQNQFTSNNNFPSRAYHHANKFNDHSKDAKILQQDYVNGGNGYNFVYQTSDGVSREEKAELRNPGTKDETLVVHGSYSYVGADGVTYTITYIADENGYRATGQHIPAL